LPPFWTHFHELPEVSAPATTILRAKQSLGLSQDAIYQMIRRAVEEYELSSTAIVDVGCGAGRLKRYLSGYFEHYVGVDVIRYEGFPEDCEFLETDLDTGRIPIPDGAVEVAVAAETIEHVENPRKFVRELARIVKPGGWVILTTPNQLSFLSLMTLLVRHQFGAFQSSDYPAHITALLEIDLIRILTECGLTACGTCYSRRGRIVMTPWHYPAWLAKLSPRRFSDNLLVLGRKANNR
jgi:2-polyprenyl-3-methyl-5-hydroxy-6-metoxy-1,4-benzoquinol methylase